MLRPAVDAPVVLNRTTVMLVSEANQQWRPAPYWISYLIGLGYRRPEAAPGKRRITLISLPCDSAAAGLIALGALVGDLGDPSANEVDGHYGSFLRFARQYLESCRSCKNSCEPELVRCGYTSEASGKVRFLRDPPTGYLISPATDFNKPQIAFIRRGVTIRPSPTYVLNYYIDGEPPPQLRESAEALSAELYAPVVQGAPVVVENLRRSYAGLCLAGRVAGEAETRAACDSIRFRHAGGEATLSELLTVQGWSRRSLVSRVTLFNSRTKQYDRRVSTPALVVADGDACFLKVLGRAEFQRSDVIGVVHRMVDRDRLEDVGNRVLGLRQWYSEDTEAMARLPRTPRGVGVTILRQRTP